MAASESGPKRADRTVHDHTWTLPEPESLGASSYMIVLTPDEQGYCGYLPEPDRPREFRLGKPFASTRIAFIHSLRTILLLDPSSKALQGIAAFVEGHLRVIFLGALWGTWVDDHGRRHSDTNPLDQLNSSKFLATLNAKGDRIRVEFAITANNIEAFIPSVRKRIRQTGSNYRIAMDFHVPSGRYIASEILAVRPRDLVVEMASPTEGFPLRFPAAISSPSPTRSTGRTPTPTEGRNSGSALEGSPTPKPSTSSSPEGKKASESPPPRQSPSPPRSEAPSSSSYGKKFSSMGQTDRSSHPAPSSESTGNASNSEPKVRRAPRLKLKPRSGSGADRPGAGGSSSPRNPREEAYVPPPPQATSYRFRPGQISDPLGRKTPFNEQPTPQERPRAEAASHRAKLRSVPENQTRPEARARPKPLPKTENMPTRELVDVIKDESDPERQWRLIEPNLMMGRAERTYSLIANFAELISERSPEWTSARLRTAFASQPGAVLVGIMDRWHMNQVLVVADANTESAKILQWLREREVDRMLRLNLSSEINSAEQARKALKVDRTADEASIRKTWRMLLQFLNADHGRRDEKAIHRQKDEIAKYLQSARDYLLKVTFR